MIDGKLALGPEGEREIVMTRSLPAPRAFFFDAWTSPDLLKRWFGPPGWTLSTADVDLKVGGGFRFVMRKHDGTEMGMRGTYREIVPGARMAHEEMFDQDWTGGPTVITTVWTERDGRTTQTSKVRYSSRAARDNVLKTGMEQGIAASFDRLEALAMQAAR